MELHFGLFQTICMFTLFILMILKLLKQSRPNLPPGPWKLPVIGSIHHLTGSLPHRQLRDLAKKHGPLMHLQLGELSVIVVSSSETAKEVMKTHDVNFANRPFNLAATVVGYNAAGIMFSPYSKYWRQLRKICNLELLSSKQVQSLRWVREEEMSKFISSIFQSPGSPINLTKSLLSLTYGITARTACGKKHKEQDVFISLVNESLAAGGGFSLADLFPSSKLIAFLSRTQSKFEKMHKGFDRILNSIIEEHETLTYNRDEADKDLVDVLLRVQEHGELEIPISIDDIKAVILEVFSAGSATSATTVEWAMSELIKNPRIMEKAQAEVRQVFDRHGSFNETGIQELEFLQLVIKETMRLQPPGPLLLPRENSERCEINGFEVPFGAGRRICPGISFGLANVELPQASFLYHFDWKVADGTENTDLDMTEEFGVTVGRRHDLILIPTAYKPARQVLHT